ncbi:SAM-dependent methyltransferase [Candidatus Marinamargulisbacteria bacterium SCGC AG-410-N11]|nr:SAM-dependent methyltransferase [Candidatus Marinamargulisbacteria bacterium SCGC AG-410-N11]
MSNHSFNFDQLLTNINARKELCNPPYITAFRLLNGFTESLPSLVIDVFGTTLVIHDYSKSNALFGADLISNLVSFIRKELPWLTAGILKQRHHPQVSHKKGIRLFGTSLTSKIHENGIWYAINLTLNQDNSFYLDTRLLRHWLSKHMNQLTVLNTFAYTGSLGIAAFSSGAKDVIQLDLNRDFLRVAQQSAALNQLPIIKRHYQTSDFWSRINQYKKNRLLFDCVILDPPIFSKTKKATIHLTQNYDRLINKVRPIINHNGYLITINNALFQSGKEHLEILQALCQDGYLSITTTIDVPRDCVGYLNTEPNFPSDPTPYNHSTKITILQVRRK